MTWRRWAPLAVCGIVLVWHSLRYDFVTDDAYISFVYSRNLAEHGQLAFNLGSPVEGYTNFLWTFLLGLLMVFGAPPEVSARVLGTGFALGTFVVVMYLIAALRDDDQDRDPAWGSLPAALLALAAGYACWSSGGLETQMFTFWVMLGLLAYVRGDRHGTWLRLAGVFFALAALTRPEGLLVTAVVGAHRVGFMLARDRRIRPSRDELWCAAWFLAIWVPYFAWRWWYYGYPLPNTYYVKAAGETTARYREELRAKGWHYVWTWASQTGIVWAAPVAVVGALVAPLRSRRLYFGTLAVAITGVYLAYTVRVGGDFMGLHRFVMPLFVLGAVAVALGVRWLADWVPAGAPRTAAALVAVAALLGVHGVRQARLTRRMTDTNNLRSDAGIDTPAYLALYARDRAIIGKHMQPCMRDDDFSILGGAGAKPYYGRMRGIDVFGLVSARVAHEVPPTQPRPGHNKWAPDKMLLEMEPTFVFSCYSLHRDPSRPQFNCNPAFWERNGYERATLYIPGLQERGEYYTFMVRKDRAFECPGLIRK